MLCRTLKKIVSAMLGSVSLITKSHKNKDPDPVDKDLKDHNDPNHPFRLDIGGEG